MPKPPAGSAHKVKGGDGCSPRREEITNAEVPAAQYDTLQARHMTLLRMDNMGIVVDDLPRRLSSFASSASSLRGKPPSKENGHGMSLDWATSPSRSP